MQEILCHWISWFQLILQQKRLFVTMLTEHESQWCLSLYLFCQFSVSRSPSSSFVTMLIVRNRGKALIELNETGFVFNTLVRSLCESARLQIATKLFEIYTQTLHSMYVTLIAKRKLCWKRQSNHKKKKTKNKKFSLTNTK